MRLEEPDIGMWTADEDPLWAMHPRSWVAAYPNGSLSRGRWLLAQIPHVGLSEVGADAEVDVVQSGTPLAEFYRLSLEAIGPAAVKAGALTAEQATAVAQRPEEPDFLACGFVHIGVWRRKRPLR